MSQLDHLLDGKACGLLTVAQHLTMPLCMVCIPSWIWCFADALAGFDDDDGFTFPESRGASRPDAASPSAGTASSRCASLRSSSSSSRPHMPAMGTSSAKSMGHCKWVDCRDVLLLGQGMAVPLHERCCAAACAVGVLLALLHSKLKHQAAAAAAVYLAVAQPH